MFGRRLLKFSKLTLNIQKFSLRIIHKFTCHKFNRSLPYFSNYSTFEFPIFYQNVINMSTGKDNEVELIKVTRSNKRRNSERKSTESEQKKAKVSEEIKSKKHKSTKHKRKLKVKSRKSKRSHKKYKHERNIESVSKKKKHKRAKNISVKVDTDKRKESISKGLHKKQELNKNYKSLVSKPDCITIQSSDSEVEVIKVITVANRSEHELETPCSSFILSSHCNETVDTEQTVSRSKNIKSLSPSNLSSDCTEIIESDTEQNCATETTDKSSSGNIKTAPIVKEFSSIGHEAGFWDRKNILEFLSTSMDEKMYKEAVKMRSALDEKRSWKFSEYALKDKYQMGFKLPCLPFKLLCYNILSQKLMTNHPYLYRYHNPKALDWNFRSRLLYAELLMYSADVLCIQELQEDYVHTFVSEMRTLGYTGLYKRRTCGKVDGVGIFFKTETFQLVDHTTVEFRQPGVSLLNRDNVGLIVKLAVKDYPDDHIVIATSHLLFNPRRHDVKMAQIQLLLAEVERIAYRKNNGSVATYDPIIITGDMNFSPNTKLFEFLTQGELEYETLSRRTLQPIAGEELGKEFLPSKLQITDNCQHWGILASRNSGTVFESHTEERKVIKLYNKDYPQERKQWKPPSFAEFVDNIRKQGLVNDFPSLEGTGAKSNSDSESEEDEMPQEHYGTGKLTIPFKLASASCQPGGVTTYQDEWLCVDHIFFSNSNREGLPQPRDLNLLGWMKLLTEDEAKGFGPIPNFISPSDHYPLLAAFELCLKGSS